MPVTVLFASCDEADLYGGVIARAKQDVANLLKKLVPLQKKIRRFATQLVNALRDQLKRDAVR